MTVRIVAALGLLVLGFTPIASADVSLFDWGINVNGSVSGPTWGPVPPGLNAAGFDWTTGYGTLLLTFDPGVAGSYSVLAFFDHEIDESENTFFNEHGEAVGASGPGQSSEIDEPGFVFGDIFDNFVSGHLDNSPLFGPEDISMAIGWDFVLGASEHAVITFLLSPSAPASGFYLHQWDPDSTVAPYDVYLSSDIDIRTSGPVVPEPAAVTLFAACLLGVACRLRRRLRA